jgi:hypothetical protein
MKPYILTLLSALVATTASAANRPDRFLCSATCVAVDPQAHEVLVFKPELGTSQVNIIEAYRELQESCDENAAETTQSAQGVLTKALSTWNKNASASSGGWSRSEGAVQTRFSYQYEAAGSGFSSYSVDDETQIQMEFARAMDPTVCGEVKTDPNGKPKPPKPPKPQPAPKGSLG